MEKRKVGIRLCSTCSKKDKPTSKKKFQSWALGFTATALKLITVIWGGCMVFAAVIITLALYHTGEFSYLDTYITSVCGCFSAAVITGLITRVVGNMFEFNNGGIFGNSVGKESEDDNTNSDVPADNMCGGDESDHGSGKEDIYG